MYFTAPRPEDAKHFAANMLGQKLITKQTGEDGLPCDKVQMQTGGVSAAARSIANRGGSITLQQRTTYQMDGDPRNCSRL